MNHIVLYSESGRFGGWPANHGLWAWENEIVVGFQSCTFKVIDDGNHAIDKSKPRIDLQARSLDGGRHWAIENGPQEQTKQNGYKDCKELASLDLLSPDIAFSFQKVESNTGTMHQYISTDRCRTWAGPFLIQLFTDRGIEPRVDYLIDDNHSMTAFFTANKKDGSEGVPFCAKFKEGKWNFQSWFDAEKKGFSIMPSTIRNGANGYLSATRWQHENSWGVDLYSSPDEGNTWAFANTIVEGTGLSNPPSLIRLQDNRLCMTYGFRSFPFGIRACLSADNGKTWEEERILRNDGGHWDLGYTRSTPLPDGNVLTIYYFCYDKNSERTIEATIWRP